MRGGAGSRKVRTSGQREAVSPFSPKCLGKQYMTKSSTESGSYAAKLKDPRWQKKRLEVLDRAGWVCEMCGDGESMLHVHHKQYLRGREPWEYDADQLASLCATCHKEGHGSPDRMLNVISRLAVDGPCGRDTAAMLIAGFVGNEPDFEFLRTYWHLGNIAQQMSGMSVDSLKDLAAFLHAKSNKSEQDLALSIGGLIGELLRLRLGGSQ